MTSREFIAAEAANADRIILYREGLFWKAYERSAFALTSQVRPLKPTRKILKSLDGGDLVSVGFPSASESATLGALTVIDRTDDRLTVAAPRPIDEREFTAWKNAIPLKITQPKPKPVPAQPAAQEAPAAVEPAESTEPVEAAGQPAVDTDSLWNRWLGVLRQLFDRCGRQEAPVDTNLPEASLRRIAQSLTDFNLADKTPMECMLFISELKNMLVKR